jgi:hypothetical protein
VRGWRRQHNRELHNLYASPNISRHQATKDEIGRACDTHGRDEKCIQSFGCKTFREEATWKT